MSQNGKFIAIALALALTLPVVGVTAQSNPPTVEDCVDAMVQSYTNTGPCKIFLSNTQQPVRDAIQPVTDCYNSVYQKGDTDPCFAPIGGQPPLPPLPPTPVAGQGDGFIANWNWGDELADYPIVGANSNFWTPIVGGRLATGSGIPIGIVDPYMRDQNGDYGPANGDVSIEIRQSTYPWNLVHAETCTITSGQCIIYFDMSRVPIEWDFVFMAEHEDGGRTEYHVITSTALHGAEEVKTRNGMAAQQIWHLADTFEEENLPQPVLIAGTSSSLTFPPPATDYFVTDWNWWLGVAGAGEQSPLIIGDPTSASSTAMVGTFAAHTYDPATNDWTLADGEVTITVRDARDLTKIYAQDTCTLIDGQCDIAVPTAALPGWNLVVLDAVHENGGKSWHHRGANDMVLAAQQIEFILPGVSQNLLDFANVVEQETPPQPLILAGPAAVPLNGDGFVADYFWTPYLFEWGATGVMTPTPLARPGTVVLTINNPMYNDGSGYTHVTEDVLVRIEDANTGNTLVEDYCDMTVSGITHHCDLLFTPPSSETLVNIFATHSSGKTSTYVESHKALMNVYDLYRDEQLAAAADIMEAAQPPSPVLLTDRGAYGDGFVTGFYWDVTPLTVAPSPVAQPWPLSTPVTTGTGQVRIVLENALYGPTPTSYADAKGTAIVRVHDVETGSLLSEETCSFDSSNVNRCTSYHDAPGLIGRPVYVSAEHESGGTSYHSWSSQPLKAIDIVINGLLNWGLLSDTNEAAVDPEPVWFTSDNFPGDGFVTGMDMEGAAEDSGTMAYDEDGDGFIELTVVRPWYRSGGYKPYTGGVDVEVENYPSQYCYVSSGKCTVKFPVDQIVTPVPGSPHTFTIAPIKITNSWGAESHFNVEVDRWMDAVWLEYQVSGAAASGMAEGADHYESRHDYAPTPVLLIDNVDVPGAPPIPSGDGFVTGIKLESLDAVDGPNVLRDADGDGQLTITVDHPYGFTAGYEAYNGEVTVEIPGYDAMTCTIDKRTCTVAIAAVDVNPVVPGGPIIFDVQNITVIDDQGRTSIHSAATDSWHTVISLEEENANLAAALMAEGADGVQLVTDGLPNQNIIIGTDPTPRVPQADGFVGTFAFADVSGSYSAEPLIVKEPGGQQFFLSARFFKAMGNGYGRAANEAVEIEFAPVQATGKSYAFTATTDADGRIYAPIKFDDLLVGNPIAEFQVHANLAGLTTSYVMATSIGAQVAGGWPTQTGLVLDSIDAASNTETIRIIDGDNAGSGDGLLATYAFSDGVTPFTGGPGAVRNLLSRDLYISARLYEDRGGWFGPHAHQAVNLTFTPQGTGNSATLPATTDIGGRILVSIPYEDLTGGAESAVFNLQITSGDKAASYHLAPSTLEVARGSLNYHVASATDLLDGIRPSGDPFTVVDSTP